MSTDANRWPRIYIRIHKRYFLQQFIVQYKLKDLINKDGYIFCQINRGMYGLKQAAILAYKQLVKRLQQQEYMFPFQLQMDYGNVPIDLPYLHFV